MASFDQPPVVGSRSPNYITPLPYDDSFDPRKGSDEDLENFFLPRPDQKNAPKSYAMWDEVTSRQPDHVNVTPFELDTQGLPESRNWSGALIPTPKQQNYRATGQQGVGLPIIVDRFTRVFGSWIVPNPNPIKGSRGIYIDGKYQLYTWVGIDGWKNPASVKIGVQSELTVSGGKIVNKQHFAAVLIASKAKVYVYGLKNFAVESGDALTGCVWVTKDRKCIASICNLGKNIWTTLDVKIPGDVLIEGLSAEWILAGKNPDDPQPHPFPNYGASVFYNGTAVTQDREVSMSRALLIDAEDVNTTACRGDQIVVKFG